MFKDFLRLPCWGKHCAGALIMHRIWTMSVGRVAPARRKLFRPKAAYSVTPPAAVGDLGFAAGCGQSVLRNANASVGATFGRPPISPSRHGRATSLYTREALNAAAACRGIEPPTEWRQRQGGMNSMQKQYKRPLSPPGCLSAPGGGIFKGDTMACPP